MTDKASKDEINAGISGQKAKLNAKEPAFVPKEDKIVIDQKPSITNPIKSPVINEIKNTEQKSFKLDNLNDIYKKVDIPEKRGETETSNLLLSVIGGGLALFGAYKIYQNSRRQAQRPKTIVQMQKQAEKQKEEEKQEIIQG